MSSKDEKGSSKDETGPRPAPASGAEPLLVPSPAPSEPEALTRELRELHDRYGDDAEIPERLIELARQVAEAYGRMEQEIEAHGPAQPPGDRLG